MQILKDNVRNSIIKYAEEEFLEKGFTDASLRTIAARESRLTTVAGR